MSTQAKKKKEFFLFFCHCMCAKSILVVILCNCHSLSEKLWWANNDHAHLPFFCYLHFCCLLYDSLFLVSFSVICPNRPQPSLYCLLLVAKDTQRVCARKRQCVCKFAYMLVCIGNVNCESSNSSKLWDKDKNHCVGRLTWFLFMLHGLSSPSISST